jgi:membrane-anchored glycerophosphoryl diester phosphodiesterase (GDPDase)
MLFDIVNLSDRLANIVQALAFHAESLGLVFFLFICTALTYASFGLQFFPEAFTQSYKEYNYVTSTWSERIVHFDTVLSCFWFLFYNFSNRGSLKAALAAV